MPATVYTQTVNTINAALYGVAPANDVFVSQVNEMTMIIGTSDQQVRAWSSSQVQSVAAGGPSNSDLATVVLENMGINNPALHDALAGYFATTPNDRGFVIVQLSQILTAIADPSHPQHANYGAAAIAWNNALDNAYTYSSNAANDVPAPLDFTPVADPINVFTLTDGIDTIPGLLGSAGTTSTDGDNTINGNSGTFNAGDDIDAGAGHDTLSLVLNEAATTYAGAAVANVEHLEIRSVASSAADADEVRVSMTDFGLSLETVTIVKSTGNTAIEDLQGGVAVSINDVAGNVSIDFDNQNVPAETTVTVNEFGPASGGDGSTLTIDAGVETVNIVDSTTGPAFYNDFMVEGGFSELNVTSGAVGTELTMGIGSDASILDVDFTGNESDAKSIFVDMSGAAQSLTLATGAYSDDVEIDSQDEDNIDAELGEGDNTLSMGDADNLSLMAGAGNDTVNADDVYSATINLGNGENYLATDDVDYLVLTTGVDDDQVYTDDVISATISLGDGDNTLVMDDVDSLGLTTGVDDDYVDIDDMVSATINLGDGDNTLYMDDVDDSLTLTTGNGVDYVNTGDVYWSDIDLGEGANTLYMDSARYATIVTGDGTDSVTINDNYWWWGNSRDLDISLGGGDDFVDLSGNNYWWSEVNGLETGGGATDDHTIAGGEGADTLRLSSLDQADADDTFANITSIETLQLDGGNYWWWGSTGGGSLDGVTTGANAAGVINYEFLYGNNDGEDITLTNVVNNVTVSMDLNEYYDAEGQNFTLTQTPDTGANVANVNFNMNDYYWWSSDDYYFGDVTVDTTEVLNMSGTDNDYYDDNETLEIQGLYSEDLTTLNLSGDLAFDFWNIEAPNLSLVDATGTTDGADIELNDVADAITVHGGSGDDDIVLKDVDSALVAHGGAGEDYIEGNVNDDHLSGGAGNDTIYAAAGVDSVYGGAGDDLILWDAVELFAVDVVDGGTDDVNDYDTVEMNGTLGAQNDSFFYQWNDVEVLDLDAGNNVLTLGIIASDAGLEELYLSDDGVGNGDSIYLVEGWSNDTAIHLSNGDDVVAEAPSVGVDLRVYADGYDVTAADTLAGANGSDTLYLTADNWWWSNLSNVTGFETVMVVADEDSYIGVVTSDNTIAAGETLTVDGRALVLGDYDGDVLTPDTAGSLYVDGSSETNGTFMVWGGDGADYLYTGAGNDTINAGEGNNYVEGGAGNDTVTAGAGDDEVYGSDGNDAINVGAGNNFVDGGAGKDTITTGAGDDIIYGGSGDDVIVAGNGDNIIVGGLDADQMSGGTGVDTYYFGIEDAKFGNADTITGFNAGDATGVEGQDLIQTWADVTYLGAYANATLGLLALQANVGGIEAVLVNEIDGQYLYIDVNGDDAFTGSDAAIKLVGLTGTLDQTDFDTAI